MLLQSQHCVHDVLQTKRPYLRIAAHSLGLNTSPESHWNLFPFSVHKIHYQAKHPPQITHTYIQSPGAPWLKANRKRGDSGMGWFPCLCSCFGWTLVPSWLFSAKVSYIYCPLHTNWWSQELRHPKIHISPTLYSRHNGLAFRMWASHLSSWLPCF